MNIKPMQREMVELAIKIARDKEIESAGIICIDGGQLAVFMSGREEMPGERRIEILEKMGEYFTRMAQDIKSGKVKLQELEGLEELNSFDPEKPKQEKPKAANNEDWEKWINKRLN